MQYHNSRHLAPKRVADKPITHDRFEATIFPDLASKASQMAIPLAARRRVLDPKSIYDIKREVCIEYGVTMEDMVSPRRFQRITKPRQIAMARCVNETDHPFIVIGRHFGGRDHSTVVHAYKKYGDYV